MMNTVDERTRAAALSLPYGKEPTPGVFAAGQPRRDQWAGLAEAGIGTVVDLREVWEPRGHDEEEAVHQAGLRYVPIPFGHGMPSDALFDRVRRVMRDASGDPVLVHCATGNRVGAALLPWWILDEGLTRDEAIEAALEAGLASRGLAVVALEYVRRVQGDQEVAA